MRWPLFIMKTLDVSGAYYFGSLPCPDTERDMVYLAYIPEG
jgi:hypothetical protein